MPRQRKSDKPTTQESADIIPAPFNHLYTGRNADEDRLITTFMLAGEALAEPGRESDPTLFARAMDNPRPTVFDEFESLLDLCGQIQAWATEDPRRAELLSQLTEAFRDSERLRVLYRRLFPGQVPAKALDKNGNPVLSDREVEVLREAAGDLTHKEIAERLGIGARTVNRHLDNIYKKLNVHKPMQAVARAISMGYLPLDALDMVIAASHCHPRNFGAIDTFISEGDNLGLDAYEPLKSLASFGLLLLLLSHSAKPILRENATPQTMPLGLVCEVDAQGEVVRTFRTENLYTRCQAALAPPHAVRHGFTPGNLFVVHRAIRQGGLNEAAVTEFTSEGFFVRSFCGAREISRRLTGAGLAFAVDGRLLAASGGLTDGILAFSDGGASVQRFAEGCMEQICIGPAGRIYASQYSGIGCIIKVFDARGQLLHSFGAAPAGVSYSGIAINSRDHVFATVYRLNGQQNYIEEFDTEELSVRTFAVPGLAEARLTIDTQDRLYVPCQKTCDVKVFSPDGRMERCIVLRGKVVPHHVAVGDDGRLWVCGQAV